MFFKKNELPAVEQMLKYMKEKYQEDFTPGLCEMASWAYSYDSMTVYSDKFPKEFIQVYRYEKKIFKDNYMSFLFREEIEQIVHDIVETLFGRCVVIMHQSNFPVDVDLPKDASLDDYLKNKPIMNNFRIYLEKFDSSKDYMKCVEQMRLQFKDKLLPYSFRLFFLKPDKSLDEITRKTENMILDEMDEDSWFVKEADFCFLDNYDLDESDLEQL